MKRIVLLAPLAILTLTLTACATLDRAATAKLVANIAIEEAVAKHCVSTGPSFTFSAPNCDVVTAQAEALAGVIIDRATKAQPAPDELIIAKQGLSDFLVLGPPHFTRSEADALVDLIAASVKPQS